MKITKNLKYADFEYDEESKSFTIIDTEDGGVVELNKVYAFAFMRFVVRMAQRNWLRQKKLDKTVESVIECADNKIEQQEFFLQEPENEETMGIQSSIQEE
tara:strand:- start:433 stop:735 length:303 start_codon:yes stop_codon:yes gene_type:complete